MADMDVAFELDLLFSLQCSRASLRRQFVDAVEIGLREADLEQAAGLVGRDATRVGDENALPDSEFGIGNGFCRAHALILPCNGFVSMSLADKHFVQAGFRALLRAEGQ